MVDWHALAEKPAGELDGNTATMIAGKLFEIDGNHDRLLAVLADPDARPEAKVLTIISLQPYLNAAMEPRLVELTEPQHSLSTRTAATQLLGFQRTEFAMNTVRGLLDDAEYSVRGAALVALLDAGRDDVFEHAEKIWHDEKMKPEHKKRLILSLPENYALTHLQDYAAAAADTEIDAEGRIAALAMLLRTGDPRWIALLDRLANTDPDPIIRDVAEQAKEYMESLDSTPDAAPPETTTDTPHPEAAPEAAAAEER